MLALDFGIEPKILSDRVGHFNPTVAFQIYMHRSTGQDRRRTTRQPPGRGGHQQFRGHRTRSMLTGLYYRFNYKYTKLCPEKNRNSFTWCRDRIRAYCA